jgi:hypothetical protein
VWFDLWARNERFGYIFADISDPDTLDNAYRAYTKRIGENFNDNPTDAVFYPPFGSVFLDEFFNGTTSEVFFTRGQPPNSDRETDMGDEAGFFELGDRMVLKLCTTTEPVYDFYSTFESQQGTNGSPFSAPANVISNINGGLGVWAGYACTFDTLRAE